MRAFIRRTKAFVLAAALLGADPAVAQDASRNLASPVSSDVAAPGGAGSAAGIAKKQDITATPVGMPGTLGVAEGVALTATYLGEAGGNPTGGDRLELRARARGDQAGAAAIALSYVIG